MLAIVAGAGGGAKMAAERLPFGRNAVKLMGMAMRRAPLTDATLIAAAKLIDDAQVETRQPSHNDIAFQIDRAGLTSADPVKQGQSVGKAKRVRAVLYWALEFNSTAGEEFLADLISTVKGLGGFREGSPNFAGADAIESLRQAFRDEGFSLDSDGVLNPVLLESLSSTELTSALQAYVRRAIRGVEDAALLTGTGKDLLEATAAHVIEQKYGPYPVPSNFPTLLGQAFVHVGFATSADPVQSGEHPRRRLERAMYETGCAINALRNKEGVGHGRPWVASVTDAEAKAAIELMGCIAERLLAAL